MEDTLSRVARDNDGLARQKRAREEKFDESIRKDVTEPKRARGRGTRVRTPVTPDVHGRHVPRVLP